MNEAEKDPKQLDRVIAENENQRHTGSDIRVSLWAIGAAVLIGFGVFGWLLSR